jgi:hypothetical protein
MTGSSDSNRSESQGGSREGLSTKEGRSKGNDRRNTNRQGGRMRAISVLGNAKSNRHRKTHQVEPDGTEPNMIMHLTRGDLGRESGGEVSRGRSSEESRGNTEGAKGRRTKRGPSANHPAGRRREDGRNNAGVAIAATTRADGKRVGGGFLQRLPAHVCRVETAAKGGVR